VNNETTAASRPLQGLRVVELGSSLAGAFCGKLLAAVGAEVVKVEPPDGDSTRRLGPFAGDRADLEGSLIYLYLNTGKLGLTLAPGSPTGLGLLRRLVANSDVVLDGLGRGQLDTLGLVYADLTVQSPGLVLAAITCFGDDGPYRDHLDGELVLLALGGLLNMVGEPEREPLRLGGYQAQYVTGLSALTGTLAALFARDLSGRGQRVEVSAHESVAFVEWKSGIYYQSNGQVRRRGGREAQWVVLRCLDGFVAFVYQDENWPEVIELIGDPRLEEPRFASRTGRLAARDELRATFERWTLPRHKTQVYHAAQAFGIPVGVVADVADLVSSPQYAARDFFTTIDHPTTGAVAYPGSPCSFDGVRPVSGRAPLLGEHNRAIFQERLGLSMAEFAGLRAAGVI
jgi:crotonobetainyl-CoA:carnitine CoA-transferase CaiB-like acyl-CoA transferase